MKQYISIGVIILASLSAYFITDYANGLQLNTYGLDNIPNSHKMLLGISKITSALVPVLVALFMIITTTVMLNDVFEKQVPLKLIFQIVGFSYIPMLLYYYFFWINLIQYCNISNVKSTDDFMNMKFMFNMDLSDFSFINSMCWIYMFIYIIYSLIKHKTGITKGCISALLPSVIMLSVYCLITGL